MFIEKQVRTRRNTYYVEIRIDEKHEYYDLQIFDKKPTYYAFGYLKRREPIMHYGTIDIKNDPMEFIKELINRWELPLLYSECFEEWDGFIELEKEEGADQWILPPDEDADQPIVIKDHEEEALRQRLILYSQRPDLLLELSPEDREELYAEMPELRKYERLSMEQAVDLAQRIAEKEARAGMQEGKRKRRNTA